MVERPLIVPGNSIENYNYPPLDEVRDRVRGTPVCLIIPNSGFLLEARTFPLLGSLGVATSLLNNVDPNNPNPQSIGNPVDILDLSGYTNAPQIVEYYMKTHPNVKHFGITATTPQFREASIIASAIKGLDDSTNIILGGPHATLTHAGAMRDHAYGRVGRSTMAFEQVTQNFDTVVLGDGEKAVFYAIDPNSPDKIIDASSRRSSLFTTEPELAHQHFPARELINIYSYHYHIQKDGRRYPTFSFIGDYGCPFGCNFCSGRHSDVLRVHRKRPVENIIYEMENVVHQSIEDTFDPDKQFLHPFPFTGAMDYRDEQNLTDGHLEELCEAIIAMRARLATDIYGISENLREKHGLRITHNNGQPELDMAFRGFVRADRFNTRQAQLMARAGFAELLTGVESGSQEMLTAMNKGTTPQINSRAIQIAHDSGLHVKALMSFGHPGESEGTIAETVDWLEKNLIQGDTFDISLITPYPGSPYLDDAEPHSALPDTWVYEDPKTHQVLYSRPIDYSHVDDYYKGQLGSYVSKVWTDNLTPERLVELRDYAETHTRSRLALPPLTAAKPSEFRLSSMGQGGLPESILRSNKY